MALSFITGRAGAGKSYYLYKNLIALSQKKSDKNFVAVVPEQFSMETQKSILSLHPNHGSFNIEVTSMTRLAYTVFEEQGVSGYKVMDELGKTLVMRKVLEECKQSLSIYRDKTSMPGFAEKMNRVVSELKQYNIGKEKQKSMEESAAHRAGLKHKLHDIEIIAAAFDRYIHEKMITAEDILSILCEYIHKSDYIKNTYFYFDGYTGFTPIQYRVLEQLMIYAPKVSVTVTLPENESVFESYHKFELFGLSKETISKLRELAGKNHVPIKPLVTVAEGAPYRIKNNHELCFVEENIFRNQKIYDGEEVCDALQIQCSANPHREVEHVVRRISYYITRKHYRYNDIAVITGDMEGYYRYLEEEFDKYRIPAFIDHKRSILANPFVDGIKAAIEVIEKDFSYDTVIHLLKLGITGLDRAEIDLLENYILQSGRRGYNSYCKQWEKKYQGMEPEQLEMINQARDRLVQMLKPLRQQLKQKNATVLENTKAIYEWMMCINMSEQIRKYEETFEREGNLSRAKEYSQIYETILSLLEKLVELMGDEKIAIRDYKQILVAGFESVKVGIIPPGLDTVMVGDIERTRLKDTKKIIFFIGVNDGIIPSAGVKGGILTDSDREFLEEHKFTLAPTAKTSLFKQKLYLYSLLAKPTEKVVLSYSKSASDGTGRRKSYLISTLTGMFPNLKIVDMDEQTLGAEQITTPGMALQYLSEHVREYRFEKSNSLFEQLSYLLLQNEETKGFVKQIADGAFYKSKKPVLKEALAKMLYGNKNNIGITRLERYAGCAYSQFLKNGLKLGERKKFEIAAFDIGNLYHDAICKFFREVQDKKIQWDGITDEVSHGIINRCVEQVMEEYDNDALEGTARNLFLKGQVREIAQKSVDVLVRHIHAGGFVPTEYELRVEHGRIDRVDLLERDGKIYVKVIDYKSGNKKFSITDTVIGRQMQLMVYLKDAVDYEQKHYPDKKVVPAAGLYFHVHDPYVKKPDFETRIAEYQTEHPGMGESIGTIKEKIVKEEQYKEYRMSGMVHEDSEVLKGMDCDVFEKSGSSNILPVSATKNGIGARSTVMQEETYEKFIHYVCKKAEMMKDEIFHGNIEINPVEGNCEYCPYDTVCGFDRKLGDQYREVQPVSLEDLKQILRDENEDERLGE